MLAKVWDNDAWDQAPITIEEVRQKYSPETVVDIYTSVGNVETLVSGVKVASFEPVEVDSNALYCLISDNPEKTTKKHFIFPLTWFRLSQA